MGKAFHISAMDLCQDATIAVSTAYYSMTASKGDSKAHLEQSSQGRWTCFLCSKQAVPNYWREVAFLFYDIKSRVKGEGSNVVNTKLHTQMTNC